jgi:hypothetical protein
MNCSIPDPAIACAPLPRSKRDEVYDLRPLSQLALTRI